MHRRASAARRPFGIDLVPRHAGRDRRERVCRVERIDGKLEVLAASGGALPDRRAYAPAVETLAISLTAEPRLGGEPSRDLSNATRRAEHSHALYFDWNCASRTAVGRRITLTAERLHASGSRETDSGSQRSGSRGSVSDALGEKRSARRFCGARGAVGSAREHHERRGGGGSARCHRRDVLDRAARRRCCSSAGITSGAVTCSCLAPSPRASRQRAEARRVLTQRSGGAGVNGLIGPLTRPSYTTPRLMLDRERA